MRCEACKGINIHHNLTFRVSKQILILLFKEDLHTFATSKISIFTMRTTVWWWIWSTCSNHVQSNTPHHGDREASLWCRIWRVQPNHVQISIPLLLCFSLATLCHIFRDSGSTRILAYIIALHHNYFMFMTFTHLSGNFLIAPPFVVSFQSPVTAKHIL